jgi:DNA (cytosine-5)-methyltransferase 1
VEAAVIRVLDLFAGIGGFSLGLERTESFTTVAFCEIDRKAQRVLRKHWPDVPVFDDVSTLTGAMINATVGPVDLICGGFPCQDISFAGRGAGLAGARSGLWYHYHRLIDELRPAWVIIENVSALRTRGLEQVLEGLNAVGYDAEWHCIPASAIGAPHQRDRIWIVAYPSRAECDRIGTESRGASHGSADCCEDVADTDEPRLERRLSELLSQCAGERSAGTSGPYWINHDWLIEPDVGRVADGVSGRVDRLKQLGNAIVPQMATMIGLAILDYEEQEDIDDDA